MRRRDFIIIFGGAAASWPLAARAQQPERMRRIGVLSGGLAAEDPEERARNAAFLRGLAAFSAKGELTQRIGGCKRVPLHQCADGLRLYHQAVPPGQIPEQKKLRKINMLVEWWAL